MGGCTKMGTLTLRDNNITSLPHELGHLKQLHVLDVAGNKLRSLPFSLTTCPLKAIWLSENQSIPLLKFQKDENEKGEKILTCFLLPQTRSAANDNEAKPNQQQQNKLSRGESWNEHHRFDNNY